MNNSSPKKNTTKTVLVVGMGMAGLMAAYTAATKGYRVRLLTSGIGALTIGSGCIDVLACVRDPHNDKMRAVQGSPFAAFAQLPATHPYTLVGEKGVKTALGIVQDMCLHEGYVMRCAEQEKNTLVPTIMGTFKPTYLCTPSSDATALFSAKNVLVVGVESLRDCFPKLIVKQLAKHEALKHISFSTAMLAPPLSSGANTHRALSPLDVARHVDKAEGKAWLLEQLIPHSKGMDAILIPPICGTKITAQKPFMSLFDELQNVLSCPLIEMACLPPGVGGIRLYTVFLRALRKLGVHIIENAPVVRADVKEGICTGVTTHNEAGLCYHAADNVILATGGILGGGIETAPGKARETVFHLDIAISDNPETWADTHVFGKHAFAYMGVRVNEKLLPIDANGTTLLQNVHVVGRTLAGYDMASEKCGNGVAIATAWHAVQCLENF